jgi:hypothetical protein
MTFFLPAAVFPFPLRRGMNWKAHMSPKDLYHVPHRPTISLRRFTRRSPERITSTGRFLKVFSALFLLAILLFIIHFRGNSLQSGEVMPVEDHHPTRPHLVLTLNQTGSSRSSVRVTLTNLHTTTSVTVLLWDSPFDPQAVQTGVFRITDPSTNQEIPSLGMKVNRRLPPSREDFLELEPRHAITKDVVLGTPGLNLEKGKTYAVQAKGRWRAVWHASVLDIGEDNLKRAGGPTGLINWDFETDILELAVQ